MERCELRTCPTCRDVDAENMRRVEVLARREMSLSDGALLIFVKGKWEIERLGEKIRAAGWRCLPFHAELDEKGVNDVVSLPEDAVRVAVVVTNAAESSLTLLPLHTVISSGRVNRVTQGKDGQERMRPEWASQEEANQQWRTVCTDAA